MRMTELYAAGEKSEIGTYVFTEEKILSFAQKYDPQRFHIDEEAAKQTVFGGLCASGWQTAATWMKCNLATPGKRWAGPGPAPVFGPSPGITNLKWLKPVYAGETISFSRTAVSHRAMTSRPGWRMLTMRAEGHDSTGAKVIEFDSAVLVKVS